MVQKKVREMSDNISPEIKEEQAAVEVKEAAPSFDVNDLKAVLVFLENLQSKGAFTLAELKQFVDAFSTIQQSVNDALEKRESMTVQNAHVISLLNAIDLGSRKGKMSIVESVNVIAVYSRLETVLLAHAALAQKQTK